VCRSIALELSLPVLVAGCAGFAHVTPTSPPRRTKLHFLDRWCVRALVGIR
jgi:hypothetical protein